MGWSSCCVLVDSVSESGSRANCYTLRPNLCFLFAIFVILYLRLKVTLEFWVVEVFALCQDALNFIFFLHCEKDGVWIQLFLRTKPHQLCCSPCVRQFLQYSFCDEIAQFFGGFRRVIQQRECTGFIVSGLFYVLSTYCCCYPFIFVPFCFQFFFQDFGFWYTRNRKQ